MCKHGDMFSLAVLIGRGLDHKSLFGQLIISLVLYSVLKVQKAYAPLAQLVEHLTLNQGVPGSNP